MKKDKEEKSKLCWNCEGSIAFELDTCSYCGVSVQPLMLGGAANLPPLYNYDPQKAADHFPEAPYKENRAVEDEERHAAVPPVRAPSFYFNEDVKKFIVPLVALQAGTLLLFFALALLFFSVENTLTLQWSSKHWYLYFFVALSLLTVGLRTIKK